MVIGWFSQCPSGMNCFNKKYVRIEVVPHFKLCCYLPDLNNQSYTITELYTVIDRKFPGEV